MSDRGFYEDYFDKLEVKKSSEEQLKQDERVKLLSKVIRDSNLSNNSKGLFVGVGMGAELSIGIGNITGLDLPFKYLPSIKVKNPNMNIIQGDGTLLPFVDSTFDYIVNSEVIEHVEDRAKLISEFSRVLKPNGILILTTPNWISFYGMARKIFELIFHKKVHADDQPLDMWTNIWSLKKELNISFKTNKIKGFWFFPPIGKGEIQIMPKVFTLLWKLLMPIEYIFQNLIPFTGHCILIAGQNIKELE